MNSTTAKQAKARAAKIDRLAKRIRKLKLFVVPAKCYKFNPHITKL